MLGDEETGWDNGINYKAISCEKIPDLFLDKLVAKNHFCKFGKITRFILRPNRQCCTVEYETEAQAERALDQAGEFNGQEFKVEYATREVAHVQNTEEWVNPEVQAELDALLLRKSIPSYKLSSTSMLPPPKASPIRSPKLGGQLPPPALKTVKSAALTEVPKIDVNLRQEYESILRRPAYTDEEKYRVLDARDKLMRLIRPRQTDIKKVESTKGICPDMCPEKERMMREFQRQVSTFEMCGEDEESTSSISHQRAIKEYSRSSADQEVPLAHELRPENVLKMTMLYLMHRIMDLCNDPQTSIGDWFHFVWDRTRSIRKDITQQELCSLDTVQLVEQCARFHIHCAARLVAEDPSVFDKKINAENLTKCLQSLKYMYHDLRIKGVHCPCEAEFRSYIILLNLGDSNFLWELKQLPVQIQNSKEIKQAIAFYNALQNNNYVRFFSMIRQKDTSYLSACILLGYINKLRWRAMEVTNKSHNWRKNAVLLPLTYLTRILGFEDSDAAAQYFSYHGLKCDGQRVLLDRLKKPDIEYAMDRAMNLVESKCKVSVGECVCGHTLESENIFESHVPHNSFDENGVLKDLAWTADDQLRGEAVEERKRQRELEKQEQQQQPLPEEVLKMPNRLNSPPIMLPPIAPPPTICTDTTVFKVPINTSSISPKNQENQQQFKITEPSQKPFGSSVFNKYQEFKPIAIVQQPALTNFKFESPEAPAAFSSTTGNSMFATKPSSTSSRSGYGSSSIFGGNASKKITTSAGTGGFIFDSASNKSLNSDNIFSSAARSTAGIFQQTLTEKKPDPMHNDSVFQHFNTQPVLSGFEETSKNIFGSVTFNQTQIPTSSVDDAWSVKGSKPDEQNEKETAKAELEKQRELERKRVQQKEAEERRRAEVEHKRKESLKELEKLAENITAQELNSYIDAQIADISDNELNKYKHFEYECKRIAETLIEQYITTQVEDLINEEYANMCHDQFLLNRYFQHWLRYTRKKQKQRALMDSTPIWVTMDTRAEQTAKLMHPSESDNLQMIKRYRHGEPCNFKLLLWKHPDTISAPRFTIDICEIVRAHTVRQKAIRRGHLEQNKYFKLLITLPNDRDELAGFESLCNKWLNKHVRRPSNTTEEEQDMKAIPYICAMENDVALCVRKVCGIPPVVENGRIMRNECDHADAIVCLMSCNNLQSTRKRIHHLIKLSRLYKSIPVAFIVYDGQYTDELELSDVLQMESLVVESKVSVYKFFGCLRNKNAFSFPYQMGRALRYVVRESSFCRIEAETLEMQKLQSWLDACLGDELWQRWQLSAEQNPSFAKVCSSIQYLIGLYNEAVQRVDKMTTLNENFEEAPEFAPELRKFVPKIDVDIPLGLEYFPSNWKSVQRHKQISQFLQRLLLPSIEKDMAPQFTKVEDCELWLLNYTSRCIPNDEEASTNACYQSIKALIEQLNRTDLADIEISSRFQAINFLSVLKAIAFTQIHALLKEYIANANDKNYKLPNEIIYHSQAIEDYLLVPWWLNIEPVELVKIDYTVNEEKDASTIQSIELLNESEVLHGEALKDIIKQAQQVSRKAEEKMYLLKKQTLSVDATELSRDLDASIYQFELAKEMGSYDVNFVENLGLIEDSDVDEGAVGGIPDTQVNGGGGGGSDSFAITPAHCRKRKLYSGAEDAANEIEEAIKRAFNVIQKVETIQDRTQLYYHLPELE